MSRAKNRRSPLHVESLERKDTPSATLSYGLLTVTGTPYADTITLDHVGAMVRVIDNNVVRDFPASQVSRILVSPQGGSDLVRIERLQAGMNYAAVYLGDGHDHLHLAPTARDLDLIDSPVNVFGQLGADRVVLYDSGRSSPDTYTVDTDAITRPFFAGLTHDGMETIHLDAETGDNVFSLVGMPVVGQTVTIDGNGGTDRVAGPAFGNNSWTLSGPGRGSLFNTSFSEMERVSGGFGTDTFRVTAAGQAWASIDGGGGEDRLDYSLYPAGVTVDLALGTATGVAGSGLIGVENVTGSEFADSVWANDDNNRLVGLRGNDTFGGRGGHDVLDGGEDDDSLDAGTGSDTVIAGAGNDRAWGMDGNDSLFGGTGNDSMDGGAGDDTMHGDDGDDQMWGMDGADILFGGAGADHLWGRDGRDILFGGAGADVLDGGAGDDILGSGTLTLGSDPVALAYLRAEWTSAHDYWDRVHNLRGDPSSAPPLNNGYVLETQGPGATVLHESLIEDVLTGGLTSATDPNHDWYFGHAEEYDPREAGEAVNA